MKINKKLEDSLNKIFSSSSYKMVDVSSKEITHRKALAVGEIILSLKVIKMIKNKKMPKGDPLAIAEVSGINGVKRTSDLIPLCHPLSLDHISIHTEIDESKNSIIVYCLVSANSKTGVEMEALSGVNSALLAIYDLSKIVEPNLKITNTKLLVKSGGKKGLWMNPSGIPRKIKKILNL
ncbi:MAG: cyclic pyranopterin monophosphate synthase MoaC [Pelagibacteraceae bacterium]|nr:cyclic pyranopterin monophosphate synthase MoaC [Candidatus Pelagibacter sp.]MAH54190.1 cyclic pyranopterin monophosphate synthase MoaC [Candidatus Pelagibacter sp.]MDP6680446.1 cyclic pyranopterin monophosphate synthase MoaC [Pelagibacteraceae bacterium]MDP6710022.1 cyclic pyranopterin monophosphate synthase MoaC [Pelagibacteraceae bacterium]